MIVETSNSFYDIRRQEEKFGYVVTKIGTQFHGGDENSKIKIGEKFKGDKIILDDSGRMFLKKDDVTILVTSPIQLQ